MKQVKITKSLSGLEQVKTFSNRYLYDGATDITSAEARNILLQLVEAEKLLYPTNVNFVRGIIQDTDAKGVPLKGRTRSVPLEDQGTFEIPVGDVLAPAHICAVIERQASLGRPGYGFYRHCVTIAEYEAWVNERTIPARFDTGTVTIGGNTLTFWQQLAENIGAGQWAPVLPDAWGDALNTPRIIAGINFGGFRINDPKRPKKSQRAQLAEGIQGQINELARRAQQAYRDWTDGTPDPADVLVIVDLATQAARIYFSVVPSVRGALKWPKIFRTLPPVNPGGVPMLPMA